MLINIFRPLVFSEEKRLKRYGGVARHAASFRVVNATQRH